MQPQRPLVESRRPRPVRLLRTPLLGVLLERRTRSSWIAVAATRDVGLDGGEPALRVALAAEVSGVLTAFGVAVASAPSPVGSPLDARHRTSSRAVERTDSKRAASTGGGADSDLWTELGSCSGGGLNPASGDERLDVGVSDADVLAELRVRKMRRSAISRRTKRCEVPSLSATSVTLSNAMAGLLGDGGTTGTKRS